MSDNLALGESVLAMETSQVVKEDSQHRLEVLRAKKDILKTGSSLKLDCLVCKETPLTMDHSVHS